MIGKETRRAVFGFLSRWIAPPIIKGLASTLTYNDEKDELLNQVDQEGNFILAFWHGQMFPVLFHFCRSEFDQSTFYTFISPHRDGEYITRAAEGLGIKALRTSLRDRRLTALKDGLRVARQGSNLAVTPDGPIGPRFEAKPGIIKLSRRLEMPILPVSALPTTFKVFDSWDKFVLPYPFGSIFVEFGQPLRPDESITVDQAAKNLQDRLNRLSSSVAEQAEASAEYRRFFPES